MWASLGSLAAPGSMQRTPVPHRRTPNAAAVAHAPRPLRFLRTQQRRQVHKKHLHVQLPSTRRQIPAAATAAAAGSPGDDLPSTSSLSQQQEPQASQASSSGQDPLVTPSTAGTLYGAMAAGLGVTSLLLGVFAPQVAAVCLKLHYVPPAAAGTLVGCFAAALLRAASVCWCIQIAAASAQLATWRTQRLNLGLALAAACVTLQQPLLGWGGAQPLVLILSLAGAAAVAAACLGIFKGLRPLDGGVIWAATGDVDLGSAEDALDLIWAGTVRTATSFAACVALLMACAAAGGAWCALAAPPPLLCAIDGGVGYMRGLLAAGLIVLAAQAAALIEYAQDVRWWTAEQVIKQALVMSQYAESPPAEGQAQEDKAGGGAEEQKQQAAQAAARAAAPRQLRRPPGAMPLEAFNALHLGLFASLAMQGAWLVKGSTEGLPINAADPVWALQYWSVMMGAVYLVAVVRTVEWRSLWAVVINGLGWAGGLLSVVFGAVFLDWSWIHDMRR